MISAKSREILTEDAFMLIELPPSDDRAVMTGWRLRTRRRQTRRPESRVQGDRVHSQESYVVAEPSGRVLGVQDHLPDPRHALPRTPGPGAAT